MMNTLFESVARRVQSGPYRERQARRAGSRVSRMEDKDRRRLLKYLAAVSAAYSSAAPAFWIFGKEKKFKPIHRSSGTVNINGKPLLPSSIIKPGDTVETGQDSELVFTQDKDAYLLRSNTSMHLNDNNGIVDVLRILYGAVLSVFGPKKKEIKTPLAAVGIRGTATYLEVSEQETYLCTCYGKTILTSTLDPLVTESISTQHHEAPRIIRNTAQGVIIEEAPVRNHTDAELILLESTVGRKPPFVDADGVSWEYKE